MSTPVFIALVVMLLIAAVVAHRVARTRGVRGRGVRVKGRSPEERFLADVRKGEPVRNLVRVYTQTDLALLRSLLSSMGVATYILFESMNGLRMGMTVAGFNGMVVQVLAKDYARARLAVEEYIINRRNDDSENRAGMKTKNVAETLVGGMFANPSTQVPELVDAEGLEAGNEKARKARGRKAAAAEVRADRKSSGSRTRFR